MDSFPPGFNADKMFPPQSSNPELGNIRNFIVEYEINLKKLIHLAMIFNIRVFFLFKGMFCNVI
jgi:hypothetical protein